ncbi:MAG: carbamate kinase [Gemmatimonadota bacterium]|nr:MAG: carbamate kinase [Gemmatimonadota bacterium]
MIPCPGTIVVAVGGNALAPAGENPSIYDQFRYTRESLRAVVALAQQGWHIALVHGNGPQVGDALVRNELARTVVEPLPLGVLVAATAGWIGYMVQQSLQNALLLKGIPRDVITLITQTLVRRDDPRLSQPTKPIGHYLTKTEADQLTSRGVAVGEDSGGRLRRLSPSPEPLDVVESDAVKQLVNEGKIVIAAGGGGPPVYADEYQRWEGVDAVVDKDLVAAILGRCLDADILLILTDVDGVYRGWGTEEQRLIPKMNLAEADEVIAAGELGSGSMRPKVAAALQFVRGGGDRAIIADLFHGLEAIAGTTGTTIIGERT